MALSTEQKMAKAFAAAGGKEVEALPWADIITLAMALFGNCEPKQARKWAKEHPVAAKALIAGQLRRNKSITPKQRAALIEAAYNTFIKASDAEIESMRP